MLSAALTLLPKGGAAQDNASVDGAASAYVSLYNEATRAQEEAYADPRGGPGTPFFARQLRDCVRLALESYHAHRSLLSSWRVASCSSGLSWHLMTWLAFQAFEQLEPPGPSVYSHPRLDPDDLARVRAAYDSIRSQVGGFRLPVLPAGSELRWPQEEPTSIGPGELPTSNVRVAMYGGVVYAPMDASLTVDIVAATGTVQRVELRFVPLSEGIREFVVPRPIVAAPPPSPTPVYVGAAPPLEYAPDPGDGVARLAVAGWVSLIVGALGAGAGAILWGLADALRRDIDMHCPTRMSCEPVLRSDVARGQAMTLAGNVLTVAGAALGALGVTLLIVDASSSRGPTVTLRARGDGALVVLGGDL